MTRRTAASGRPLQFVPDDALEAAMGLFWERGFEAVSLDELQARTGLSRSSLYNSFGSKKTLFDRAIAEYRRRGEPLFRSLESGGRGLEDVHQFIDRLVRQRNDRRTFRGCLMVNSMIEFGGRDAAVARSGKRYFGRVRDALAAALRRAARLGEIPAAGIEGRARLLLAIAIGVNVEARAGATSSDLRALAAAAHEQVERWRVNRGRAGSNSARGSPTASPDTSPRRGSRRRNSPRRRA